MELYQTVTYSACECFPFASVCLIWRQIIGSELSIERGCTVHSSILFLRWCQWRILRGCTVHLLQKRPNWRITYLLYYSFDYKYVYIYRLAIICSIAHKILVAMVTTFENTSLATAKPAILWQNFQLQSCLELNFEQLCN